MLSSRPQILAFDGLWNSCFRTVSQGRVRMALMMFGTRLRCAACVTYEGNYTFVSLNMGVVPRPPMIEAGAKGLLTSDQGCTPDA
jgi:hypothetical protein